MPSVHRPEIASAKRPVIVYIVSIALIVYILVQASLRGMAMEAQTE